jgi:thioesterase domain-containing protein
VQEIARELAVDLLRAEERVHPRGPADYALAGWSFGGIVACEVGRELLARGRVVSLVGAIDTYGGGLGTLPREAKLTFAAGLAKHMAGLVGLRLKKEEVVAALSASGMVDTPAVGLPHFLSFLRLCGALPENSDPAPISFFIRAMNALMAYEPVEKYPSAVTVFRCVESLPAVGADYGWTRLTSQLEVLEVPGNHFSILEKPHVEVLATTLEGALSRDHKTG